MTAFKITPFKVSDLYNVEYDRRACMNPLDQDYMRLYEANPSYTCRVDGKVLVCWGVVPLWEGCGEAWAVFSKEANNHKFLIMRNAKSAINFLLKTMGLRRIQAICNCELSKASRLLDYIGFKNEGMMKHYGSDGKSYFRYAIFPEDN